MDQAPSATVRVPRDLYRHVACELTERYGEFDAYQLAAAVGRALNGYVSYCSASAWIRRHYRGNGSYLRLTASPTLGRVRDGGRPASYAVVLVELMSWRIHHA
jgi:hypothetical protein